MELALSVFAGLVANGLTAAATFIRKTLMRRASPTDHDDLLDALARYAASTDAHRETARADAVRILEGYLKEHPDEEDTFRDFADKPQGITISNQAPNKGQQGIFNGGTFNNAS